MTFRDLRQKFVKSISNEYDQREAFQVFSMILEDLFSISKTDFLMMESNEVPVGIMERVEEISAELIEGKPIQYVLGQAFFDGHLFKVTPDVLIPRPETEELVHWIHNSEKNNARFVDIGSGSGCIQIALSLRLNRSQSFGVDVSQAAINVAVENAEKLNVLDRCQFIKLDILSENLKDQNSEWIEGIDFIVSNPPYIPPEDKHMMAERVTQFEPHLALFSDNPVLFYQAIASQGCQILRPGGHLYFELHEDHAGDVIKILLKDYEDVCINQDLHGKPRMIRGRLKHRVIL